MKDSVVKSAGRVFEVLELFSTERRTLTATELSRALRYPASSTVALLKSMLSLGYLSYDPSDRTYFPTPQLAVVSCWLEDSYYTEGHLFELMNELSRTTGESVFVAWQNDLWMQRIEVKAEGKECEEPKVDTRVSIFESIAGLTALSLKRDVEIAELAERINTTREIEPGKAYRVNLPAAMDYIRSFRTLGHGIGDDCHTPGVSHITWPLRQRATGRVIVVAIAGPSARIKNDTKNIVQTARAVFKRHIGTP